MSIAAIILAAGLGSRAQYEKGAKQYYPLAGKSILYHSVSTFINYQKINPILVVIHKDDHGFVSEMLKEFLDRIHIVIGGKIRQESAYFGLLALKKFSPDYVHIHDAARPFLDHKALDLLHQNLSPNQGAILAHPVSDSLKKANQENFIEKSLDRTKLFCAQTPQTFPFQSIINAHVKAAKEKKIFTDDAAIAEYYHLPVKILSHSSDNFKLTWPEDFDRAEYLAIKKEKASSMTKTSSYLYPDIRVGNGYDIHSFIQPKTNEPTFITLCGIKIPFTHILNGHSDSDVALHALTDALLGVIGAGDIGTYFPPNDPKWKNADSTQFLLFAYEKLKKQNAKISNIDISLIAEQPQIGPHRSAMVKKLSQLLNLQLNRISIKATTNEKLGALGRGEGIAALATICVIFPKNF